SKAIRLHFIVKSKVQRWAMFFDDYILAIRFCFADIICCHTHPIGILPLIVGVRLCQQDSSYWRSAIPKVPDQTVRILCAGIGEVKAYRVSADPLPVGECRDKRITNRIKDNLGAFTVIVTLIKSNGTDIKYPLATVLMSYGVAFCGCAVPELPSYTVNRHRTGVIECDTSIGCIYLDREISRRCCHITITGQAIFYQEHIPGSAIMDVGGFEGIT